jgi:RimJ/RimL family protein N-acetyltransferase
MRAHKVLDYVLRKPEPRDIPVLYKQKNDPEIASLLGGFSSGYTEADLAEWIEFHRQRRDEVLWVIAGLHDDTCIGHVGLYQIDFRVRSAEFAIMLGDSSTWGKGLGTACARFAVEYGFRQLNLNRIHLNVLSSNLRAVSLYERIGFQREGTLRQAQYKDGQYLDVIVMGLLRSEYVPA